MRSLSWAILIIALPAIALAQSTSKSVADGASKKSGGQGYTSTDDLWEATGKGKASPKPPKDRDIIWIETGDSGAVTSKSTAKGN